MSVCPVPVSEALSRWPRVVWVGYGSSHLTASAANQLTNPAPYAISPLASANGLPFSAVRMSARSLTFSSIAWNSLRR